MSEPRTEIHGPAKPAQPPSAPPPDATAAVGPPPPPAPEQPQTVADVQSIAKLASGTTDDSPTIISRAMRRPLGADESITAGLRGKRLAHFELLEAVGVGGMAAVIRAQDTQLDRIIALKILPPQLATDPESIRRFNQEARAAARLDHENIARVFYCGEDQGLHFIAFEFVEGDNLRMILERRGQLPVSEAVHYMLQVATGLAHAAARGVVHRDIKPSNIIITPTGKAKLVDMGLARSLGPQRDGDLTQSGVTLGTFDYISPEQALEPRDADSRSDIYSLGCTFYHMLTGQPPVPEGTAAKKLHYHQHVPPIDPRQLNPDISDEVAALLGRMMAKDPKDRYQKPEHLVQHLVQLAQKLGYAADVPEGVVFADGPLPGPPRPRPVLVGLAAAAVVVGLVALLSALPSSTPTQETPTTFRAAKRPDPPPPDPDDPPETPPVRPVGPDVTPPPKQAQWIDAANPRDLAQVLKQAEQQKQPVVLVRLTGDSYPLRADDGSTEAPGLRFRGERLEIKPADPNKRPTISLTYDPKIGKDQLWAALTVAGGKAIISGVRFSINATGTAIAMAGLAQRDGGTLLARDCEFVQSGFAREPEQRHMASIQLPASASMGGLQQSITLERCFFRGGDDALQLTGSAGVHLIDCAFGPHTALVHCSGPDVVMRETEVALTHCSALLEGASAAFLFDGGASCKMFVNHCLFSCPSSGGEIEADGAVLVRQVGERGDLHYESQHRNVFHNLIGYSVHRAGRVEQMDAATLDGFKRQIWVNSGDRSLELLSSPWLYDQPLKLLDSKPKQAFTANVTLPELRQEKDPTHRVIGVERSLWSNLYPTELPPVEEKKIDPVARKFKTVDPKVTESGQGRYPTVEQAVKDCKSGDTILIAHTGVLPVDTVRLEKAGINLTIRPHRGFKPILTLGETAEADAALFRLHDGKVAFEDLEFRLKPQRAEFKAQSIVLVIGDGQCTFKNCLATLHPASDVPLALIALADPSMAMKMEPVGPRQMGPRLALTNCFVRGEGDLISVRASRPFTLDAEDSLVALDGSFVVVDGNGKEAPAKPGAQITLRQVTAFLGEYLIQLRASKEEGKQGLIPTQVLDASNCLFHTARGRTLVHLENVDSDEQMKRIFFWEKGKQNVYSGFGPMLDQLPRGDNAMALPPYDQDKWENFTPRETERRFTKVKFAAWPIPDRQLFVAWPANFRVKEPDLATKCGAPVEKLPRPTGEGDLPPALPDSE
jgi:serine/threonine protein kinase